MCIRDSAPAVPAGPCDTGGINQTPAASAGASVWHRKGREGDGIVQRDEGRRGVRLRRLRTGDPDAQVLRGQRRGCLLLLGAALLLRRAACAQEVGSRLRPRKARTRAIEGTKSTVPPNPEGPIRSRDALERTSWTVSYTHLTL